MFQFYKTPVAIRFLRCSFEKSSLLYLYAFYVIALKNPLISICTSFMLQILKTAMNILIHLVCCSFIKPYCIFYIIVLKNPCSSIYVPFELRFWKKKCRPMSMCLVSRFGKTFINLFFERNLHEFIIISFVLWFWETLMALCILCYNFWQTPNTFINSYLLQFL
jgi:hypothetical protein